MPSRPSIVAVCGSLRRGSYNRMLMGTALQALAPVAQCAVLEWRDVPPFDADALESQGLPAAVARVRQAIGAADGVLTRASPGRARQPQRRAGSLLGSFNDVRASCPQGGPVPVRWAPRRR